MDHWKYMESRDTLKVYQPSSDEKSSDVKRPMGKNKAVGVMKREHDLNRSVLKQFAEVDSSKSQYYRIKALDTCVDTLNKAGLAQDKKMKMMTRVIRAQLKEAQVDIVDLCSDDEGVDSLDLSTVLTPNNHSV